MSWVYTLTAEGTTLGFERGYFAFVGDPFSGDVPSGNLKETLVSSPTSPTPEASTLSLTLLGLAGLLLWRWPKA